MAHYALLDENNTVVQVIVGRNEDEEGGIYNWEKVYAKNTGLQCKQTSYNTIAGKHILGGTPFRKNYAGIGYTYDPKLDAFIPPQPYPSWILNKDSCTWDAPVAYPNSSERFVWDEPSLSWVQQ